MQGIILDGIEYDVRVKYETLTRSFSILEGTNSGQSISGKVIRDIIGTTLSYTVQIEPNPNNMSAYYDFYEVISQPITSHVIVMPYNNTTIQFDAQITGASDVFRGELANQKRWGAMKLSFKSNMPLRKPVWVQQD